MVRRRFRRFPARRAPLPFQLLALAIAFLCVLLLLDARLRPTLRALAALQAESLAVQTMHQAAAELLAENAAAYRDLVQLHTDENGAAQSVTTDAIRLNQLKSALTLGLAQRMDVLNRSRVSIPLGSALGVDFLAGRGPLLHVRLTMAGSVQTDFSQSFDAAGINQTRHRILLHIRTQIYILLPGQNSYETVETDLCVAETIIVGAVPEVWGFPGG